MEVVVTEGEAALDLPEWGRLAQADPEGHIFATPEWNRLWWEEFGEGKQLFSFTFKEDSDVAFAGLIADETDYSKRIRFVGGDDLTDYLGPIVPDRAHQPAVAEALLRHLAEREWDYFQANCLPVPLGFSEWLVEAADRLKMPFRADQSEITAVLALPETFDDYVASLPPKKRHELRRKVRRFDSQASGAVLRRATEQTLGQDLDAFVGMHRGSEGLKGKFMLPQRASFFRRVGRDFQPAGYLALDFLEYQGRSIASTFSFEYRNVFYLYNSAYDHDLREISPGLILVAKLIERAIERGFSRFDFLRGQERYKFDLGAEALPLNSVRIDRI